LSHRGSGDGSGAGAGAARVRRSRGSLCGGFSGASRRGGGGLLASRALRGGWRRLVSN